MDQNKICIAFVLFICRFLNAETVTDSPTTKPEYIQIFEKHQHWYGYYKYNNANYYCELSVHSEHYKKPGGLLATFNDKSGTTVEFEGEAVGNAGLDVKFTVHTVFNSGQANFPRNFTFTAILYVKEEKWNLHGTVDEPLDGPFGDIDLQQKTGADSPTTKPEYIQIFEKHQHWYGYYKYNNTDYYCGLFVHSEHYKKPGGLLATFNDKSGTTVEFEGEAVGFAGLEAKFTVHTVFNSGQANFPRDFTFTATLYKKEEKWNLHGTVDVPLNGPYGDIDLQTDAELGSPSESTSSPNLFLILGIPIILTVIGIFLLGGLLHWAVRKGYIRYVPKTYDNFNNPVEYSENSQQVQI
ncbi:uncharacterized protein LOC128219828 [Mya arenaria]|uniref:uncharacterized protein LOC128219828 n=1 Tax=Mya arenaria TaxID=6604 RepID=UPI0022E1B700|nr:uncharacterized protein LOC128219828 [Mya arenaria]